MTVDKYRENIPFFSDLPAKAEKAATALWDACRSPSYNGASAYSEFVQDLSFQSVAAPPRAIVKRWIAGVQAGLVPRPLPASPIKTPTEPETILCDQVDVVGPDDAATIPQNNDVAAWKKFGKKTAPEVKPAAASSAFQTLTPSDFLPAEQVVLDPAEALGAAFEHLVDAAIEELQRDVRKQARIIAASRMRQMLDAMEASDA
jgi:hypothetical protein